MNTDLKTRWACRPGEIKLINERNSSFLCKIICKCFASKKYIILIVIVTDLYLEADMVSATGPGLTGSRVSGWWRS